MIDGGGGQTIKAVQPIDRRPTIIQTLTEKKFILKGTQWHVNEKQRQRLNRLI